MVDELSLCAMRKKMLVTFRNLSCCIKEKKKELAQVKKELQAWDNFLFVEELAEIKKGLQASDSPVSIGDERP